MDTPEYRLLRLLEHLQCKKKQKQCLEESKKSERCEVPAEGSELSGKVSSVKHNMVSCCSQAGVREINILLYLSKQCDRPNIHEP